MVGQIQKVIIDEVGENVAVGRTEFDSPEIDNIVRVNGKVNKGVFYNVKIDDFNEYELIGSV
jgi:ribosomal protein S12 methylthiotransferase